MARPRKSSFTPTFSVVRNKWVVEIPASVAGKRSQRWFSSQSEALEVAAAIARSVEDGQEVSVCVVSWHGVALGVLEKALAETSPCELPLLELVTQAVSTLRRFFFRGIALFRRQVVRQFCQSLQAIEDS